MTPTLAGRWQTRLLLLSTIGLAVTLLFSYFATMPDYTTPLALLSYVLGFGLVWDWLYNYLQRFRWDRDWPPAFQLFAGIWEGFFIWVVIQWILTWQPLGWPQLPGVAFDLTLTNFLVHYTSVWLTTFLASQSLLRIIFPRWRFHGGEWL